jgi:hypothetical protein
MTQDQVKQLFDYRNGKLYWKEDRGANKVKGLHAGSIDSRGYRVVQVNKKIYKEHRLVFLYFNGTLPKTLDHINRDKADNRIENLRAVSDALNAQNRKAHKNNVAGHKNVSYHKKRKCYYVRIMVNYEEKFIGSFKTLEEAIHVAEHTRKQYHEHQPC